MADLNKSMRNHALQSLKTKYLHYHYSQKQKIFLFTAISFILCLIFPSEFEKEARNQKANWLPILHFSPSMLPPSPLPPKILSKTLDGDFAL